jgi:hypothetical protein
MAASKSKYQVSVTKLHRLPPIREESMSGRTPRSGRRTNRDSYLTSDGKITVQQLPKPTIHVHNEDSQLLNRLLKFVVDLYVV